MPAIKKCEIICGILYIHVREMAKTLISTFRGTVAFQQYYMSVKVCTSLRTIRVPKFLTDEQVVTTIRNKRSVEAAQVEETEFSFSSCNCI